MIYILLQMLILIVEYVFQVIPNFPAEHDITIHEIGFRLFAV